MISKMKLDTDEGYMYVSLLYVKFQKQFIRFDKEISKGCCIPIIQFGYCIPIIQIRESTGTVQPVFDIGELEGTRRNDLSVMIQVV